MRKMLLIGTAAALGVVSGAAYAANPNVPSYSPYALMDVAPSGTPALVLTRIARPMSMWTTAPRRPLRLTRTSLPIRPTR